MFTRIIAGISLFLAATSIHALVPSDHRFDINAEAFTTNIRESYYTHSDNKLSGIMLGVNAGWMMHFDDNFTKINVRYAASRLEHKDKRAVLDKGHAFNFEARGVFGHDFLAFDNAVFSPYIGMGYGMLRNDAGKDLSKNPQGWHFAGSNQLYVPIGVDFRMPVFECYSAIANMEFDALVNGRIRTKLPSNKNENSHSTGYGFRMSAGGAVDLNNFAVEVKPFFHFTKVDGTKHTCLHCGYGADPKYTNRMFGLSVGAKM
jgi:hypothetical protein